MAKLKEGSVILTKGGEQEIATKDDVEEKSPHKGDTPPSNTNRIWIKTIAK